MGVFRFFGLPDMSATGKRSSADSDGSVPKKKRHTTTTKPLQTEPPTKINEEEETTTFRSSQDEAHDEEMESVAQEAGQGSLSDLSNSQEVTAYFRVKWFFELNYESNLAEDKPRPYHTALDNFQGVTGKILFSESSREALKSKLKTDFGFHPAPANEASLLIFEMKGK